MTICGCCGSQLCPGCDPANPLPLIFKTDIGGPYTCKFGGSPPCAGTVGGLYNLVHKNTLFGEDCSWGYKSPFCTIDGVIQYFWVDFSIGAFTPNPARLVFLIGNPAGPMATSGLYQAAHPGPDCYGALNAGLVLNKVSITGDPFCLDGSTPSPAPPNTIMVWF